MFLPTNSFSALRAWISLLFLATGFGYCTEPLRIAMTDSFDPSRLHFQAVAEEISSIVAAKFVAPPVDIGPIQCIWRDGVPETLVSPGQIVILLSAKDEHWAQLAFQLGHELGHVYLSEPPLQKASLP
jgi:hypothetical protein